MGELTSAIGRNPTPTELNEHLKLRLQASLGRAPTALELFFAMKGVREARLRHMLGRPPTEEEMQEAESIEARDEVWAKVGRVVSTPLVPTRLAALAGANRSLRKTLQPLLAELREQHGMARELCRKLGRTPRETPAMIELNGEGRGLTDADMGTLSQLLPFGALASCRYVYLSNNEIGEWGIRSLTNVLLRRKASSRRPLVPMRRLEHLYLSGNRLGDAGVRALADALGGGALAHVTMLWLDSNQVGDEGMQALADIIQRGALADLREISLSKNQVGDTGMARLCQAATQAGMARCQGLYLSENRIGNVGMHHLSEAIAMGALPTLHADYVFLGDNPGDDAPVKMEFHHRTEHLIEEERAARKRNAGAPTFWAARPNGARFLVKR